MIVCRMSPIWWREREKRKFYLFVYFVLTIKTIPKNHSNYILNIFVSLLPVTRFSVSFLTDCSKFSLTKQLSLRLGAMKQIRVKKKLCV